MKKELLLIALMALVLLAILPASAWTVTMANPDATGQRDVIVYLPNGTLWGVFNTTSTIDLGEIQNTSSFIFTLKPQSVGLDDPREWLDTAYDYVETNVIPLLIIIFLIGLFWAGRK